MKTDAFCIGKWTVEPSARRISDGSRSTTVEYKVMQVLVCLASRAEGVVTRDEILSTVWSGTVVGDGVLTRAISELRKAFGDEPASPEIIETVPRVGYRLLLGVADKPITPRRQWPPMRSRVASGAVGLAAGLFIIIAGYVSRPEPSALEFGRTVRLTSDVGHEIHPALSADGSRLVFSKSGSAFGDYDLVLKLVGSDSEIRLTNGQARDVFPAWSPDAKQIAFIRRQDGTCYIMVIGAHGGPARHVAACLDAASLAWSPDGTEIVYSDRNDDNAAVRIVSVAVGGSVVRPLSEGVDSSTYDMHPLFSTDGRSLAYVRQRLLAESEIVVQSAHDASQRVRIPVPHSVSGLTWLDEGRNIGYSSYHGDSFAFWSIAADGSGEPKRLLSGLGGVSNPIWSSAAGFMYVHTQYVTGIRHGSLGGDGPIPSADFGSTQSESRAVFSPDGSRTVYVSNRTGVPQLWVRDNYSGSTRSLTDLAGHFVGVPVWSRDGRHVVFSYRSPGDFTHVYSVELDSGMLDQLTNGPADFIAPSFSFDGQRLYVGTDHGGTWTVYRRSWRPNADARGIVTEEAGGEWVATNVGDAMAAQESPDGNDIYYVKRGSNGIWRSSISGGTPALVIPSLVQIEDWANWTVESDGIYFVRRQQDYSATLSRWAFGGASVEDIVDIGRPQRNSGISISPDRERYLYTQTLKSESDILQASFH